MAKQKRLTQRQLAVLDDLFGSELDEDGVLEKHRVRRSTYDRWLGDEVFLERYKRHLKGARRQSELLMTKYSCLAATKLVGLTASGKGETARRACMDVMMMPDKLSGKAGQAKTSDKNARKKMPAAEPAEMSPEKASRLLAVLAEGK